MKLNLQPGTPGTAGAHTQHRAQPHGRISMCTQEHPKPCSTPVPFSTPKRPAAAWVLCPTIWGTHSTLRTPGRPQS